MTREELIEECKIQISKSENKNKETNKVVERILSLKYNNNKDVPNSEKIRILEEIRKQTLLEKN